VIPPEIVGRAGNGNAIHEDDRRFAGQDNAKPQSPMQRFIALAIQRFAQKAKALTLAFKLVVTFLLQAATFEPCRLALVALHA
jgi:hypothetical protein